MNTDSLPDKLSDLLVMATLDARKVQQKKVPGFTLNMFSWHHPADSTCYVCMAGAVMACELDTNPDIDQYPTGNGDPLVKVDYMRRGAFISIVSQEYDWLANILYDMIRSKYNEDIGNAPWSTYIHAARMLKAAGL